MRLVLLLALVAAGVPAVAAAQGEVGGRVVTADSGHQPIRGIEVSIPRLRLVAVTDSSGRYRLRNVPAGEHLVTFRGIGFQSESTVVRIDGDEVVSWDAALSRATTLPERVVTAPEERIPAKLAEFAERQKAGIGHFIDRKQLERAEGGMRQTGDLISLIPGVRVRRGGSKAWVATLRAPNQGGTCAFCPSARLSRADSAAGARGACYMDVYVDGAMVFDSRTPQHGLFDVNTIPPEHIAGIEVYTSAAQIPARYNRTAAGCGVVLIWTR